MEILVVEDDAALSEVLALHLGAEGWTVRVAGDGEEALLRCAERRPDVVVLDVQLPRRSGIEVCAALRATYQPSPGVVMVTARGAELDVMLGFEVGADDYVIKPCRPREIVARVKALARRLGVGATPAATAAAAAPATTDKDAAAPEEVLHRGALTINLSTRRVLVADIAVRLTGTEFALLAFLARAPERVYSRMQLLDEVWDSRHEGYTRNVDCHVTRVRKKLEAAGITPAPIETVHGTGYRFVTPPGRP